MLPCHIIIWSCAGIIDLISSGCSKEAGCPKYLVNIRNLPRKLLSCTALRVVSYKLVVTSESPFLSCTLSVHVQRISNTIKSFALKKKTFYSSEIHDGGNSDAGK